MSEPNVILEPELGQDRRPTRNYIVTYRGRAVARLVWNPHDPAKTGEDWFFLHVFQDVGLDALRKPIKVGVKAELLATIAKELDKSQGTK